MIDSNLKAQDLKWGFEEWELIDGIETPSGWDVNTYSEGLGSFVNRFYKDSMDVVEGQYSLRAMKDSIITSAFLNCTSMASLYLDLDVPLIGNQSVYFSVKTESLTEWAESLASVKVGFSKGNDFLGRVEWVSYEEIEEFVEIELPILFDDADALSISIDAASQNGGLDDCQLESIVWIDNLRIEQSSVLDVDQVMIDLIVAQPNPTDDLIKLSTTMLNGNSFEVKDIMGRTVQRGTVENEQITLNRNGLNVIHIARKGVEPIILKVIKVEK